MSAMANLAPASLLLDDRVLDDLLLDVLRDSGALCMRLCLRTLILGGPKVGSNLLLVLR
jgi:hypothetical protein